MSKSMFRLYQPQESEMKRIFFIVALLILGGISLSTDSTANAMPALKSVGEVVDAKGSVQLATGYWHWRKHYWRHHYGHYDNGYYGHHDYKPYYYRHGHYKHHYYPKHYKWHGHYKGCYEYGYKWWCKKDFYGEN
jgi:hypothetical protein